MVGAHDIRKDGSGSDIFHNTARNKEIVDTPPHILLTRTTAVAPPAVGATGIGMQLAETVGESCMQQLAEAGALLVGKSGITPVRTRIGKIYLLMCHIEIATYHNRLLGIQTGEESAEISIPTHPVAEASQLALRIRHVYIDKIKTGELKSHDAPLMVVLVDTHRSAHTERLMTAVYGSTGIPLAVGIAIESTVALMLKISLPLLHLYFLNAEKIGIRLFKHLSKALSENSPEPVDVPRYEFHILLQLQITPRI